MYPQTHFISNTLTFTTRPNNILTFILYSQKITLRLHYCENGVNLFRETIVIY